MQRSAVSAKLYTYTDRESGKGQHIEYLLILRPDKLQN